MLSAIEARERYERGRELFFGVARCGECHSHARVGGQQATDLTDVGSRLGRAELLEAIRDPSAAIEPGLGPVDGLHTGSQCFAWFMFLMKRWVVNSE